MSIFFVIRWTAFPEKIEEVDRALARIQEHVLQEHPRVLSVRCWRVRWDETPARPGFIWMEEFESLTSMDESDNVEATPVCDEVWSPIYAYAVPGTITSGVWRDTLREGWFAR